MTYEQFTDLLKAGAIILLLVGAFIGLAFFLLTGIIF